ncbi:MAG: carbohydrate ABC transporter permease [Spirochaetia bacterium]
MAKMNKTLHFFKSPLRILLFILILGATLLWLLPFIVAILTSFRTNADIMTRGFLAFPEEINLDSFVQAWNRGGLNHYLPNSFIITIPSIIGTLFLSSLSAYALVRFKFLGRNFFYFLCVGGMMLPFQILMLPVVRLTDAMGLYDTHMGIIMFHTAFQIGFCTFVLRNYMITVPPQIFEAARIDGCSELRIYAQIMIPLILPAFAALATLEFTWIFNDYLWAIVLLRSETLLPVTAGLALLQGQYIMDWTVIIAGSLTATLPTILIFIFLQRYFIAGLTMGSNK